MTRECMYCGTNYGEKCPHCGGEKLVFRFNTPVENSEVKFKIFTCLNALCPGLTLTDGTLAPSFKEGEGPHGEPRYITSGICRACLARPEDERMELHRRKTGKALEGATI